MVLWQEIARSGIAALCGVMAIEFFVFATRVLIGAEPYPPRRLPGVYVENGVWKEDKGVESSR